MTKLGTKENVEGPTPMVNFKTPMVNFRLEPKSDKELRQMEKDVLKEFAIGNEGLEFEKHTADIPAEKVLTYAKSHNWNADKLEDLAWLITKGKDSDIKEAYPELFGN